MQLFASLPKKDNKKSKAKKQKRGKKNSLKPSNNNQPLLSERAGAESSSHTNGNLNDSYTPDLTSFDELGLAKSLLVSCRALQLRHPTRVQFGCIPAILKGRDVIACARTGTGKTGAFALPILSKVRVRVRVRVRLRVRLRLRLRGNCRGLRGLNLHGPFVFS